MSINFKRSRTIIKTLISKAVLDEYYNICGWVQLIRKQPPIHFIQLNDGSTVNNLQVVILEEFKNPDLLKKITRGASIKIYGKLIHSPKDKQPYELIAEKITILGLSEPSYPITKQAVHLEYLRTIEHFRIRTSLMKSVHRIRNGLSFAIHTYFQKIDCQYVNTPIITSNDCEGAGETFTVTTQYPKNNKETIDIKKELFKKPTFLTVSGQLHGESYALGLGDIYTFGPTFRAEKSNTSRHLNEFWMVEPELSFIDQNDLHNLTEDFVKYCVNYVLTNYTDELLLLNERDHLLISRLEVIKNKEFEKISYKDVIKILKEKYKLSKEEEDVKIEFGLDLPSSMEKFLTDIVYKKPVIIYNYPKVIKSFYMKSNEENEDETVQAMDLLVPGIGELIGGSIREDDYNKLFKSIKNKKISNIDWYLDLRKYGSVPHGGFGLGFERLVQLCTGMTNIRDVIAFPRYPKHVFG